MELRRGPQAVVAEGIQRRWRKRGGTFGESDQEQRRQRAGTETTGGDRLGFQKQTDHEHHTKLEPGRPAGGRQVQTEKAREGMERRRGLQGSRGDRPSPCTDWRRAGVSLPALPLGTWRCGAPGPCPPCLYQGLQHTTGTRVGRQGRGERKPPRDQPSGSFLPWPRRAGVPARGSGAASKGAGRGRDRSEGGTARTSACSKPAPPWASGVETPREGAEAVRAPPSRCFRWGWGRCVYNNSLAPLFPPSGRWGVSLAPHRV